MTDLYFCYFMKTYVNKNNGRFTFIKKAIQSLKQYFSWHNIIAIYIFFLINHSIHNLFITSIFLQLLFFYASKCALYFFPGHITQKVFTFLTKKEVSKRTISDAKMYFFSSICFKKVLSKKKKNNGIFQKEKFRYNFFNML